jgi:Fe-coproporphyrin III synthase
LAATFISAEGECVLQTNSESLQLASEPADETHRIHSLPILVIHAHSSCNCRCVMCDIWKTREQKIFGVSDLNQQLNSIRQLGVQWIVFSGGEPLMNPELPEVCSIVRAEGIRLTLLTTGLLLKKYGQNVADHFDDIIISLDGPQNIHDSIRRVKAGFSLIESGVKAIRELRPDIRITARCTVQKANYEYLFETAQTAKLLGLNGISFLAADLTSQAFNRPLVWPSERQAEVALSLSEVVGLEDEIERLIRNGEREFGVGFIVESAAKLRHIVRHFRAHLGLDPAKAPMCNAPWVSAVIEADGSVRPCFFHPPIGSVRRTSLEDVVNGEQARNFRARLDVAANPTCQNCVCSLNYRD